MKAAILGFGTVGAGVYDVLTKNRSKMEEYLGQALEVGYILDIRDLTGPASAIQVRDVSVILEDPTVDVVIECMGGIHPALEWEKAALEKGKSVVTSNKELVEAEGAGLMALAFANKVDFMFEASVGGGIPVIRTLRHALAQEKILSIKGILNGTTNYILTRMEEEGLPYEMILKDAQDLGYAERDPEADVEGYDACRKIAILASMVCGSAVHFEDIPTTGITKITLEEIRQAKENGQVIRLVAEAEITENGVRCSVGPKRLDANSMLAGVRGVNNAVLIQGNMVGDVLLAGQGAGRSATASAVAADVLQALKNRREGLFERPYWK